MEKRLQNFEKWKASSLESKSPSARDLYRDTFAEKDEVQHKRQRTEDLGSVSDSHLGVSHPDTRSERPTSNEEQRGETAHMEGVPQDAGRMNSSLTFSNSRRIIIK